MSNFSSIHFHTSDRLYVYSLYLWKRIDHLLITSGIYQDTRNYSACDLKCRYRVFTLRAEMVFTDILAIWVHFNQNWIKGTTGIMYPTKEFLYLSLHCMHVFWNTGYTFFSWPSPFTCRPIYNLELIQKVVWGDVTVPTKQTQSTEVKRRDC